MTQKMVIDEKRVNYAYVPASVQKKEEETKGIVGRVQQVEIYACKRTLRGVYKLELD